MLQAFRFWARLKRRIAFQGGFFEFAQLTSITLNLNAFGFHSVVSTTW